MKTAVALGGQGCGCLGSSLMEAAGILLLTFSSARGSHSQGYPFGCWGLGKEQTTEWPLSQGLGHGTGGGAGVSIPNTSECEFTF